MSRDEKKYLKDGFYARRVLFNDEITGLNTEIRATKLLIDAKKKEILVEWELCLCTSNKAVLEVIQNGRFRRHSTKYDNLKSSAIGQGIKQMLEGLDFSTIETDLSNFPQCFNQPE